MMEDVARRPDADRFMKKLNWVGFGGGKLTFALLASPLPTALWVSKGLLFVRG